MEHDRRSLVLLGMRGCGKSAVGARVARLLGARFVDLDDEVLTREGFASVADLWEALGQRAFREAEARALGALLDEHSLVLALGGGTLTAPGATEMLDDARRDGRVFMVYLRCDLETLQGRLRDALTAGDASRPSVTGDDPVRELGALLRAREPVYRAACDVEVDGASGEAPQVADRVRAVFDQAASR